jgi:hypothetical protein
MSNIISSIDCLAVKINEEYFNALKKDIDLLKNKSINLADDNQLKQLNNLADSEYCNIDAFYDEQCFFLGHLRYYEGGKHSDNFAYASPLDLDTGKQGEAEDFSGYVYEFGFGSGNVYEPEFKDKEDLINTIKDGLYIPTTFDLEHNIIFLTGITE